MDETLLIVLLSLYGFFSTLLFVCLILFCRMNYQPIDDQEN